MVKIFLDSNKPLTAPAYYFNVLDPEPTVVHYVGGDIGLFLEAPEIPAEEPDNPLTDHPEPAHPQRHPFPVTTSFLYSDTINFMRSKLAGADLRYLIDSVFLHPKLPQQEEQHRRRKDTFLIEFITSVAAGFGTIMTQPNEETSGEGWRIIKRMLINMLSLHSSDSLSGEELKASLLNMNKKDVIPLYITAQNAGVIFRKDSRGRVTFESFEASLPNGTIMGTVGKVFVQFPANPRLLVSNDAGTLEALANLLSFFESTTQTEDALPTTSKGGAVHTEVRDTCGPRYITEATAGFLRAMMPSNVDNPPTAYIRKRVGDHVLWNTAYKPWRRPPIWLVIRVALQSTMAEMGLEGTFGYKVFQTFLMAHLLDEVLSVKHTCVSDDILYLMNAKVARRLWKMKPLVDSSSSPPLRFVAEKIIQVSFVLEQRWKSTQRRCIRHIQWIPPTPDDIEQSLELSLLKSNSYLRDVIGRTDYLSLLTTQYDDLKTSQGLLQSCSPRLSREQVELPPDINKIEPIIGLYDFEAWVAYQLPTWSGSSARSERDCQSLSSIMDKYLALAKEHYSGHPERISIMVLCLMELWVALDALVVEWCPLMKEFSPPLAPEVLDPLLLPLMAELRRLHKVQSYLRQRHQYARSHGGLSPFGNVNDPRSFPNRFFETSLQLQTLKARIEDWANTTKQTKLDEMAQKNQNYHDLLSQSSNIDCTRKFSKKKKRNSKRHKEICKKCKLEAAARGLLIIPYENPLPNSSELANPIVFELDCPIAYRIWRSQTYQILLLTLPVEERAPTSDIYPLISYKPLGQFATFQSHDLALASTAKSIAQSHYSQGYPLPVKLSQIILPHAGKFQLFDISRKAPPRQPQGKEYLLSLCTLQLDSPYVSMQKYVGDTTHSPNLVLACQMEAPPSVSIDEYVAFGHLRSGNRIQWYNIVRSLIARSPSFSEPGIFSLVMQAIWQAGPEGDDGIYREAHVCLTDERLGQETLSELRLRMDALGDNWKEYLVLAVLVALATRLHSLTPHPKVAEEALSVLSEARQLALRWLKAVTSKGGGNQNDSQKTAALLGAVCRSTFDLDGQTISKVFEYPENITSYVFPASFIPNVTSKLGTFPHGLQLLFRKDQQLSHKLEDSVFSAIKSCPRILDMIAEKVWSSYIPGGKWSPLSSPGQRWWKTVTPSGPNRNPQHVYIDILSGTTLVNGKTLGRLPISYLSHPSYKELFESLPSFMRGMDYEIQYRDLKIHFLMAGSDLIIRAERDGEIEEFIPTAKLENDIPDEFLQGRTLWYIDGQQSIDFRPEQFRWMSNSPKNWMMRFSKTTGLLRGHLNRTILSGIQQVVDPYSPLFRSISKVVEPLEPQPTSVIALLVKDGASTKLTVSLPRHNLEFFVNSFNHLECRSIPGYVVDIDQDIGTLYGLREIVVLREALFSKGIRKLIIPKGTISVVGVKHNHPDIHINSSETSGVFIYEVDDLVGRLVGNRTLESELFLTQLHAYTSSHLSDPLIRRTGTEEALDRLSGSTLFSYQERPNDWTQKLQEIAKITVRRVFYPEHLRVMEKVSWNPHLPVTSQHIAFQELTENIVTYWKELEAIYEPNNVALDLDNYAGNRHLHARARLRLTTHGSDNSALRKIPFAKDSMYLCRDTLSASLEREALSFRAAAAVIHGHLGLPVCDDLEAVGKSWKTVNKVGAWQWKDIAGWFSSDIGGIWATLYYLCRKAPCGNQPSPAIVATFALLAYRGIPLAILGTLVTILKKQAFRERRFDSPQTNVLDMSKGATFVTSTIQTLLTTQGVGFDQSEEFQLQSNRNGDAVEARGARERYLTKLKSDVSKGVDDLKAQWPRTHGYNIPSKPYLRITKSFFDQRILPLLTAWSQNRTFLEHLRSIAQACKAESRVTTMAAAGQPQAPQVTGSFQHFQETTLEVLLNTMRPPKLPHEILMQESQYQPEKPPVLNGEADISTLSKLCDRLHTHSQGPIAKQYNEQLRRSLEAYQSQPTTACLDVPPIEQIAAHFGNQTVECTQIYDKIKTGLTQRSLTEYLLQLAGLWPRVSPKILLRRLSLKERHRTPNEWTLKFVKYANSIASVQQARRLLRFAISNQKAEYTTELLQSRQRSSSGEVDWLLFEIDSDRTIRNCQIDTAQSMIRPENGENSVMQLNMGEGKSSVIVPIAAVSLADTRQLVRVVVLKAQLKQQLHLLRQQISDICNRRILYLPLDRTIPASLSVTRSIRNYLQVCQTDGGIWLCQPEQILSFKLLGLDRIARGIDAKVGRGLIEAQLWTQHHTRDILDESDEILSTKHQLIYTVGEPKVLDNAPDRWEIIQDVLGLLQLQRKPKEAFFVSPRRSAAQFPYTRMLSEGGKDVFRTVAREVIWGNKLRSVNMRGFPTVLKAAAFEFITEPNASEDMTSGLRDHCLKNQENSLWQSLLSLRGLIAQDLVALALKDKRWRVNYGLDLRRSQLAVPYRAKDTPSSRSEFAHPDLALLLTCLSYYYQGLTDSMLLQTIHLLGQEDGPDLIYQLWIQPCWEEVPIELRTLSSVNMGSDHEVLQALRPFLSHNKNAIDYFLNTCVFPREAKEFPFKMSVNGWDIAMKKDHITTGFSGTNDTRFLLPTSIHQHELPAQSHTNAKVLALLLQEENSTVIQHASNLSASQLLDQVMALDPMPTVFLDVGAQILDRTNQEFSVEWLGRYDESSKVKAAIYFDGDDNICVITRDGTVQRLLDSPYLNRLDECLVYLDDVHTRGTDFKFPTCRALVTLGPKLTKDKLVQGCMRMRKLGSAHSVIFLAPQEVTDAICKATGCAGSSLTASDVLLWTMIETCHQLQANVANWALQGHSFARQEEHWEQIRNSKSQNIRKEAIKAFYEQEARNLGELYDIGGAESMVSWAKRLHSPQAPNAISRAIAARCSQFEEFSFIDSTTQEEKEVELVHEQEVERKVQRAPLAQPMPHKLHPDVTKLVRTGVLPLHSKAIQPVSRSLEHISLPLPKGFDATFSNLFATADFSQTIQINQTLVKGEMNAYLRQVEWVVAVRPPNPPAFVFFSPFEVNQLLPLFRTSKHVTLHPFSPRSSLPMRSLENLNRFSLPTTIPPMQYPGTLLQQLDLFSGTLYFRDKQSYENICSMLRLYFGTPPNHISESGAINSNGFITTVEARNELGLTCAGFEENPTHFLRQFISFRRHGRGFLPSHMGHILHGLGLGEEDFAEFTG